MTRTTSKSSDEIGSIRESYLMALVQSIRHEISLPMAQISQLAKISGKHIDDLLDSHKNSRTNSHILEKVKSNLNVIAETSSRASNLTDNLLVLSETNFKIHQTLDLNSLIRDEIDELRTDNSVSSAKVDFSFEFQDPQLICGVYKEPFLVLIRNLALNAIESMHGKRGLVVVKTYSRVIFAERKAHVYVEVTDQGRGISFPNTSDIFKGGSTTKTGAFRGWGLWLSKLCLGQMKGRIFVRTGRNSGTSFTIRLPK